MLENRRSFIKKTLSAGAVAMAGSTVVMANAVSSNTHQANSNGVVIGKSNKKEILYKETLAWEDFYRSSY
jgi:hypothetical protein